MMATEAFPASPPSGRELGTAYPGAICHVMNRGDRREPIFQDEADRQHA